MADLLRVSVLGSLPGNEKWSVNPVFSVEPPGGTLSPSDLAACALAVDNTAIPAGMLAVMNTATSVIGSRVEARTDAGVLQGVAEHTRTTPAVGTGAVNHPYQTSMVLSLLTTTPGGRGRGRLYWPATGVPLDATTLRITSSARNAFNSAFKQYLLDLTTILRTVAPLGLTSLQVWSRANNATYNVSSIRTGDIADVQRRRRDQLAESYTVVAYP